MKSLRVLVVDDEPPARRKLIAMLGQKPDVEVLGEAANGLDAAAAIDRLRPDAVFLDVRMPGLTGFEVLEEIPPDRMPLVVFVTAYDQHAVKAFEVDAVDYLLKPFDRDRLQQCLDRLREQRKEEQSGYLTRVIVKSRGRIVFLKLNDVDWIATSANYVELHSGKQSYLLRETLTALESRLDPRHFARIHRSTVVNLDRIQELQPSSHNDFIVLLKDGTKLRMSRRYRGRVS